MMTVRLHGTFLDYCPVCKRVYYLKDQCYCDGTEPKVEDVDKVKKIVF